MLMTRVSRQSLMSLWRSLCEGTMLLGCFLSPVSFFGQLSSMIVGMKDRGILNGWQN